MSPIISQKTLLDELSKVAPEWNIQLFPHDYVENPEKFNIVVAFVTNKKNPKLIGSYTHTGYLKHPQQYGIIYAVIAGAIHPKRHDGFDLELAAKFSKHMDKYWKLM
ncbi:hypothetical protein SKA08_15650 [Enterococcus faecium]